MYYRSNYYNYQQLRMASSQYSVIKHTILPLIFKISHKKSLSYLIKDPASSSLVLLPSNQQPHTLKQHIANIQQQFKCKLTHCFISHGRKWEPIFQQKTISAQSLGDIKPFLLGELSLCFIKSSGYEKQYSLIAATHISSTSTKFPVLFVGNMLSACSIDIHSTAKAQDYIATINKMNYFPNETLIFPERKAELDNLQFAYALEKNDYLARRIEQFKEMSGKMADCLIPTSILEQKTMNPYLKANKYSSTLGTNDKVMCFDLLRKMRMKWRKQ